MSALDFSPESLSVLALLKHKPRVIVNRVRTILEVICFSDTYIARGSLSELSVNDRYCRSGKSSDGIDGCFLFLTIV